MERPTCKTCPYWDRMSAPEEGSCQRHAPRPLLMPRYDAAGEELDPYEFPVMPKTMDWEFCGEHPDFPAWIEAQRKTDPPATVE